jgi:nucleotide-binding universal stress UspA family protein
MAQALPRFETLLVAIDFSPDSEHALDLAIELAKSLGAAIHLVHSYLPAQELAPPFLTELAREFIERVTRETARRMERASERVRERGVACEIHLTEEIPAAAIPELAGKLGADLIVMGTRGNTGLRHVLLGSVAERTVRAAPCPVLTAHAPDSRSGADADDAS